ncbi:MAG: DUF3352 domain-containing protein [Spirulinaceae cyanobacterium SM2_1_0]|nr:DUF3352 domain-containing protein [Spirulinaceae cyanobacterium SM2_1_0]
MTLRSFFITLGTVVFGALVLAIASFFWLLAQSPLSLGTDRSVATPSAAMFVPRQAPLVASLLVNPSRLEALLQLQRPLGDRRRVQRELSEIETGLLERTGLRYRRDIRPWLGDEVTVALTALDFDRDPENGQQPGYLLIATAKDGQRAREFLQVFFARSALAGQADLEFEPYQGTNLIYPRRRETGETPLASAVVGDRYVLFANHPQVLRAAINNVQATRLNLATAPAYQRALATLTAPRIATVFANLPALAAAPPGALPPEPPTLMLSLQASDRGLTAQTALAGFAPARDLPTATAPVAALDYLPAASSVAIAGRDLQALWQQLNDSLAAGSPLAQLLTKALAKIEEPLGVDLARDVFDWARGEYALALLPSANGAALDWVFAAERSEGTAAAIAHFDDLARDRDLSVGTLPFDDLKVTAWTQLLAANRQITADVRGVRASVGDYELLASSLNALEQALDNPADPDSRFRQAFAQLPAANNGSLYVDWSRSQPLLERRLSGLRLLTATAQPLLERLRAFALVNTGQDDEIVRAAIAFDLTLED